VNPVKGPTEPDVRTVYPPKISRRMRWLGSTALVLGVLCVAYGFYALPATAGAEPSLLKQLILAAWIVLPPGWFCIEYFLIYKKHGLPGSFESFKQGQEVAAKFWLAVGTVLSALYVGPHVIDQLSKHSSH
jgi:hypothetical protein